MTPNNIAGMAVLAGLNIVALTDHNSAKNCPAFFKAAKRNGIIPVAGMELTTAEDIHLVCLFEHLEAALEFDNFVSSHRILVPNRVDIFGEQLILDENDEVIGVDDHFLPNATDIMIDDAPRFVSEHSGICYPAHIDREANGVISTLGIFPDNPLFKCAEFHDAEKKEEYLENYPEVRKRKILVSSDAHYLWDIRDKSAFLEINDDPYSSALVRQELFKKLSD